MLRVLASLTTQHDPLLLAVAGLVCVLSVVAALSFIGGARRSKRYPTWGPRRLLPAAAALGAGVWATHFVAMLAYDPGLPEAFDLGPTLLSALISVVGALISLVIWANATAPLPRVFAGIVLGLAIGAMHHIGMAALHVPGHIVQAPDLAIAAVLLGSLIFAAAMEAWPAQGGARRRPVLVAALVGGVLVLHTTGMGGVIVIPDPTVALSGSLINREWLALVIGAGAVVVLVGILIVLVIEVRVRLQAERSEGRRLRSVADASFEGLILCAADGRITEVNSRITMLSGHPREALIGRPIEEILAQPFRPAAEAGTSGGPEPVRTMLRTATEELPVELSFASIDTAEGTRQVVAIRDLRERLQAEARIVYLAHHDPLTGLANRTVLHEKLQEACRAGCRNGDKLAVLCIDLDRFKPINDMFGHAAGDEVLRETARRLMAGVRATDTVARVGGDEFVVLQRQVRSPSDSEQLARKLLTVLGAPIEVQGHAVQVAGSIGIATLPDDAAEAEVLLANADLALYRVKAAGRGAFAFFHPEMDAEARRRRELEHDLTLALAGDGFSLHWQPQAGTDDVEIVGFEALLRWRHPQRGDVSPAEFIPVAEATGMITAIGEWVLRTACAEAAGWDVPLRVAVNISPAQIQQDGFVPMVRTVLRETGLAPERLELEVTEGMFIRDADRALAALKQVKAMGVQVAIDDFGTGFSSLSTLRAFPFDRIKIDRSFVRDIENSHASAAIVRAVIGLGQGLGLPVVAEGVETRTQLAALAAEACTEVQGYLISKPLPIGAFAALLHPVTADIREAA